jgi:hypothetical protein
MSQPLLSAAAILGAVDLQHEIVAVPEWGGDVRVQQLGAAEMTEFTATLHTVEGEKNGMYVMLIFCLRDLDGNRIFTMADFDTLRNKNFQALNRLQTIALRLNQLGAAGEAALKKG